MAGLSVPGRPLGLTGAQVLLVLYQEVAATVAPPGGLQTLSARAPAIWTCFLVPAFSGGTETMVVAVPLA